MIDSSGKSKPGSSDDGSARGASQLELLVFGMGGMSVHPLPAEGRVSIGRSSQSDICLDDPSVSRNHAVLHLGSQLLLEDLGGANGTFFHDRAALKEGAPLAREGGLSPGGEDTVQPTRIWKQTLPIAVGAPILLGALLVTIRRAQPEAGAASTSASAPDEGEVGPRSPAMLAVDEQARLAAQSRISVLLLGETGVGKEVLARRIHEISPRADKAFLGLNCAALSETLLEAELFGHEKGAFTGALSARAGLLESADGGTVFLDEVGEMPLSTQVKLLRVIEERKVLRIGGRSPRDIGVRFIAATNRDLEEEIARGTFRQDLFFRLNGIALTIPPLRERTEEIRPLCRVFVANASRELERSAAPSVSEETLVALERYGWPGNVRELRNVIERAVVLCLGDTIRREHLPPQVLAAGTGPGAGQRAAAVSRVTVAVAPPAAAPPSGAPGSTTSEPMAGDPVYSRERVIAALEACAGNQTQAAAKLGITRRKLIAFIEEHDLPRPRKRP